jgi:hypothetical protein
VENLRIAHPYTGTLHLEACNMWLQTMTSRIWILFVQKKDLTIHVFLWPKNLNGVLSCQMGCNCTKIDKMMEFYHSIRIESIKKVHYIQIFKIKFVLLEPRIPSSFFWKRPLIQLSRSGNDIWTLHYTTYNSSDLKRCDGHFGNKSCHNWNFSWNGLEIKPTSF